MVKAKNQQYLECFDLKNTNLELSFNFFTKNHFPTISFYGRLKYFPKSWLNLPCTFKSPKKPERLLRGTFLYRFFRQPQNSLNGHSSPTGSPKPQNAFELF